MRPVTRFVQAGAIPAVVARHMQDLHNLDLIADVYLVARNQGERRAWLEVIYEHLLAEHGWREAHYRAARAEVRAGQHRISGLSTSADTAGGITPTLLVLVNPHHFGSLALVEVLQASLVRRGQGLIVALELEGGRR